MTEDTLYSTIAEAEAMIIAAGYIRDTKRHVWTNGRKTAKVLRTLDNGKTMFFIQWG